MRAQAGTIQIALSLALRFLCSCECNGQNKYKFKLQSLIKYWCTLPGNHPADFLALVFRIGRLVMESLSNEMRKNTIKSEPFWPATRLSTVSSGPIE